MSIGDEDRSFPKSMRQRKILDVAAENPDASIAELASLVPSANPDLVEQVLEEHGDPGADDEESTDEAKADVTATDSTTDEDSTGTDDGGEETMNDYDDTVEGDGGAEGPTDEDTESNTEDYPSPDDLSTKQREVLELIAAEPSATQQTIGEYLDVSASTVSNRVNSIEGFDWSDRESFVDAVLDEPSSPDPLRDGGQASEAAGTDPEEMDSAEPQPPGADPEMTERMAEIGTTLDRLDERMTDLENTLEQVAVSDESLLEDPELAHKIVHACMESDTIDESEELRILKALLE